MEQDKSDVSTGQSAMDEAEIERRVKERVVGVLEKRTSQLKVRYREQALAAVEEAKKEGYEAGLVAGGGSSSTDVGSKKGSGSASAQLKEAERRGYEMCKHKYSDALKRAEDDARRSHALLAMRNGSSPSPGKDTRLTGPNLLVKYLIEEVYREIKHEFSEGDTAINQLVQTRMKGVLRLANDSLVDKLGHYDISFKGNTKKNNDTQIAPAMTPEFRRFSVHVERSPWQGGSVHIPRALRLHLTGLAPEPKHIIGVKIDSYERSMKGIKGFLGVSALLGGPLEKEIVRYSLTSVVQKTQSLLLQECTCGNSQASALVFVQDRRYKEFKALYVKLKKEFPYVILPPVPDVDILTVSNKAQLIIRSTQDLKEHSKSIDGTSGENGILRLGVAVEDDNIHDSHDFLESTGNSSAQRRNSGSDSSKTNTEDSLGSSSMKRLSSLLVGKNAHPSEDVEANAEEAKLECRRRLLQSWLQHLCLHSLIQTSPDMSAFLKGDSKGTGSSFAGKPLEGGENIAMSEVLKILSPLVHAKATQNSSQYQALMRESLTTDQLVQMSNQRHASTMALKDMEYISRDIKRLDKSLGDTLQASAGLYESLLKHQHGRHHLGMVVRELSHKEASGPAVLMGSDTLAWGFLGHALATDESVNTSAPSLNDFNMQLCFLKSVYNASASTIEIVKNSINNHNSINSSVISMANHASINSPSRSGEEETSIGKSDQFSSDEDRSWDLGVDHVQLSKLKLALHCSQEWDICRRIRKIQLVGAMREFVVAVKEANARATELWNSIEREMQDLDFHNLSSFSTSSGSRPTCGSKINPQKQMFKDIFRAQQRTLGMKHEYLIDQFKQKQQMQREYLGLVSKLHSNKDAEKALAAMGKQNKEEQLERREGDQTISSLSADEGTHGAPPARVRTPQKLAHHHNLQRAIIPQGRRKEPTHIFNTIKAVLGLQGEPKEQRNLWSELSDDEPATNISHSHKHSKVSGTNVPNVPTRKGSGSRWDAPKAAPSIDHHRNDRPPMNIPSSSSPKGSQDKCMPVAPEDDIFSSHSDLSAHTITTVNTLDSLKGTVDLVEEEEEDWDALIAEARKSDVTSRTWSFGIFGGSSKEEGGIPAPPVDSPMNQPCISVSAATISNTSGVGGASLMNREIERQQQQREEAERKEYEEKAAHQRRIEETTIDFHERRLRGRVGAHGTQGNSLHRNRSAMQSRNKINGVRGWSDAPKPAEILRPVTSNTLSVEKQQQQMQQQQMQQQQMQQQQMQQQQMQQQQMQQQQMQQQQMQQQQMQQQQMQQQQMRSTKQTEQEPRRSRSGGNSIGGTSVTDLPGGWQQVTDDQGRIYYYHEHTRVSRWEKPTAKLAEQHAARLNESIQQQEAKVNKRRSEVQAQLEQQDEENRIRQNMGAKTKEIIRRWSSKEIGFEADSRGNTKCIGELLGTLHNILDFIDPADISAKRLGDSSPPSDIKKAYLKTLRFIHPDKLPQSLDFEKKVLAEAVFIFLNELYDDYKTLLGI